MLLLIQPRFERALLTANATTVKGITAIVSYTHTYLCVCALVGLSVRWQRVGSGALTLLLNFRFGYSTALHLLLLARFEASCNRTALPLVRILRCCVIWSENLNSCVLVVDGHQQHWHPWFGGFAVCLAAETIQSSLCSGGVLTRSPLLLLRNYHDLSTNIPKARRLIRVNTSAMAKP